MTINDPMHVTEAESKTSSVRPVEHAGLLPERPSLMRFAWWTVPLHVAMGFGFCWMIEHDPDGLASAFVWVHLGVPAVLLVTAGWWWDRKSELAALLCINHAATFAVLLFMPWSF